MTETHIEQLNAAKSKYHTHSICGQMILKKEISIHNDEATCPKCRQIWEQINNEKEP